MTTEAVSRRSSCCSGTWTGVRVIDRDKFFLSSRQDCNNNNNNINAIATATATACHHRQPVEQKALDAMMDYLREYLRQVDEAEPREGDGPLDKIAAGHADYSNYR